MAETLKMVTVVSSISVEESGAVYSSPLNVICSCFIFLETFGFKKKSYDLQVL